MVRVLLCLLLVGLGAHCYQRLERTVRPLGYRVHITPVIQEGNLTYTGEMSLDLWMNDTNELSLDCDDSLKIDESSMSFDGEWSVSHSLARPGGHRLVIVTSNTMKSAYKVQLNLTFSGSIRKDLAGFYLSSYVFNGTRRQMASTQFETSGARKTFPCFDEPAFRSKFNLSFSLDPAWRVISNTLALDDYVSGGVRQVVFEEMKNTPIYLVGWAVFENDSFGRLDWKTAPTGCASDVTYNVWSNREYTGQGSLALSVAPLLVQRLENFTGITCKAVKKKMDLVAIPDFSPGAMENWGIITFRETALLFDKAYSTVLDSEQVTMIVSHELVHQWFGNLVTPDWWSYTWLSEGFARYLQYFITHEVLPTLELDKQFLLNRRQLALEEDGPSSHPLTKEVLDTISDIEDMFDIITYEKGACVIHMYRSLIGDEEFKKGINSYLTKVDNAGGVANPDLFFSSFPTLPAGMRRWTETSGYPVIIVNESEDGITLQQIKIIGWNKTEVSDWLVPISININGEVSTHYLQPNQTLKIPFLNTTHHYFINVNQTGYYRVLYHYAPRWRTSQADKSSLVDDALALAYAGLLPFQTAIGAAVAHLSENPLDYFIWSTGLKWFDNIAGLLDGTELEANFTGSVVRPILDEAYEKVVTNSTENSFIMKLHQMNIMKYACKYGYQDCLNDAKELSTNISDSNPERRAALICTVVREGNSSTWEMVWSRFLSAKSPAESNLMLRALSCTLDRQLIKRFLGLFLHGDVRKHDVTTMISLVSSRRLGAEEAFSFFKNHYTQMYIYFGETRSLRKILSSVTKFFNDTQLAQLKVMALERPELNLTSFIGSLEKSMAFKKKVLQQLTSLITKEPVPDDGDTSPDSTGSSVSIYNKINIVIAVIIFLSTFIINL